MTAADQRYRREYRVTPTMLWYPTITYTIGSAALVLRMAISGVPAAATIPIAVFLAALLAAMFGVLRNHMTIADEGHLTIRRLRMFGGDRSLAWSEVQGIEVQANPGAGAARGTPRQIVMIYTSAGGKFQLPHLHDRGGVDLWHEVAALRELWILGRGEDWRPNPQVAAKIAFTRKHPLQLAIVAMVAGMAAFLAGIVIFFIVLVSGGYADGGATVFQPVTLLGVFPGTVYVLTFVIVGLRRSAERRRH